jgi:hypothetical protein
MPAKPQPLPVVHQLQNGIRAGGVSLHELGRRTGVSEGQLSRFLRGDRTLTLPAAARVCLYFGLALCPQGQGVTESDKGNRERPFSHRQGAHAGMAKAKGVMSPATQRRHGFKVDLLPNWPCVSRDQHYAIPMGQRQRERIAVCLDLAASVPRCQHGRLGAEYGTHCIGDPGAVRVLPLSSVGTARIRRWCNIIENIDLRRFSVGRAGCFENFFPGGQHPPSAGGTFSKSTYTAYTGFA